MSATITKTIISRLSRRGVVFANDILTPPSESVALTILNDGQIDLGIASYNKFSLTRTRLLTSDCSVSLNSAWFSSRFSSGISIPGLRVVHLPEHRVAVLSYLTPTIATLHVAILEALRDLWAVKTVVVDNSDSRRLLEGLPLETPYLALSTGESDSTTFPIRVGRREYQLDLMCRSLPPMHQLLEELVSDLPRLRSVLEINAEFPGLFLACFECLPERAVCMTPWKSLVRDLSSNLPEVEAMWTSDLATEEHFDCVFYRVPRSFRSLKKSALRRSLSSRLEKAVNRLTRDDLDGFLVVHSDMYISDLLLTVAEIQHATRRQISLVRESAVRSGIEEGMEGDLREPEEYFALVTQLKMSDNFNFNLAAGGLNCRVTPLAALQILEAHQRRETEDASTLGALLGRVSGNILEVTEALAIPHEGEALDKDYLNAMLNLKKKTAPARLQESLIGWFTTVDLIDASWLKIHNYFAALIAERSTMSSGQSSPLLLQVDIDHCAFKAHVTTITFGADTLVQFHQLPTALSNFQGWADALAFLAEPAVSDVTAINVYEELKKAKQAKGDAETVDEVLTCLKIAEKCVEKIASSHNL